MHGTAEAQADSLRARRDSVAADSARSDSLMREDLRIIEAQKRRADSIKTPTAAAEMPVLTDIGDGYRWDRDALFASGALTLADLLESVPGLTTFRSGWIGSPQSGAFAGDFRQLRVFYDGRELDGLDPRNGGIIDLSFVQIWQLEEVRIERGASEIRVHLRSWRVQNVTPRTRVDIGTGDLETNGYRGFFGRRFAHGEVLQLGAFQVSSRDNRNGGDIDQLSLFGRVGWAKGRFSFDGSFLRTNKDRSALGRDGERPALPSLDATYTDSYARAAFTDPGLGIWAQLMASSLAFNHAIVREESNDDGTAETVIADTTAFRSQYVAAAGWSRNGLSVSATGRLRDISAVKKFSPSVRASYETPRLSVALFGEQAGEQQLRRMELSGRFLPLPYLAVGGAVSRTAPTGGNVSVPTGLAYRGEIGLRIHSAWLTAGVMSRDTAVLVAPVVFDTGFRATSQAPARGFFVGLRGKVWKDVGFDVSAVKWDSAGPYRPEFQTRSQIYVNSDMRRRFPSGNLHVLAAVTHEYRTAAFFPIEEEEPLRSSQYRTLGFLLEIRLLTATLSYQFRNLLNAQYSQVPGFPMPRPVQFYGVRWEFFN